MQFVPQKIDELTSALDLILPPRFLHCSRQVSDCSMALLPDEQKVAETMKGSRLQEFSSARAMVRDLIQVLLPLQIDIRKHAILPDADGAPVWPSGLTGCISHSKGICSVVIAKSQSNTNAVGIDIETLGRLSEAAKRRICSPAEQQRVEAWAEQTNLKLQHLYTLVFSAKEAFFKYAYPSTRQWLEFKDVELNSIHVDHMELESKRIPSSTVLPLRRNVYYQFLNDMVVTAVWN